MNKPTQPSSYTLTLWRDDMGQLTQRGCSDATDALWHINSAREHDGLCPLSPDQFGAMLAQPNNSDARATLTPVY